MQGVEQFHGTVHEVLLPGKKVEVYRVEVPGKSLELGEVAGPGVCYRTSETVDAQEILCYLSARVTVPQQMVVGLVCRDPCIGD